MDEFKSPLSRAIQTVYNFQPLVSIVNHYLDLSTFIIPLGQINNWWMINRRKRSMTSYEFVVAYEGLEAHQKYLQHFFEKARSEKVTVCGEYLGFMDLITPIFQNEKFQGYLLAGAFVDKEMTYSTIKEIWGKLTGLEPSPALPEFRKFVRVLLEMPVLDSSTLPAFQESFELMARILSDAKDVDAI